MRLDLQNQEEERTEGIRTAPLSRNVQKAIPGKFRTTHPMIAPSSLSEEGRRAVLYHDTGEVGRYSFGLWIWSWIVSGWSPAIARSYVQEWL